MATNVQLLKDALRNEGLLYTPQRQIIWDEICKTDDHRDAEEIYFKIKQGCIKSQEQRFTVRLMYW